MSGNFLPPGKVNASTPSLVENQSASPSIHLPTAGVRVYVVGGSAPSPVPAPTSPSPGKTSLLLVTSAAWVDITPLTDCATLKLIEDNSVVGAPTTPFQIARPTSSDTPNQFGQGQSYVFTAPPGTYWAAGVTIGAIRLPSSPSASTYFGQSEDGGIGG